MKTIQEHIRLAHLLAKRFLGSPTATEAAEVEAWRRAREHAGGKPAGLPYVHTEWLTDRYAGIDAEEQWLQFRKRTLRRQRRVWLRAGGVAAGLCLVAGIALLLQPDGQRKEQAGEEMAQAAGIRLMLSDGKTVDLSNRRNLDLRAVEGNVVLHDGRLEYREDTLPGEELPVYNTLSIPPGAFYHLILPDGTKVWLNSSSQITYPIRFAGGERKVRLEGEAYFDVAQQAGVPFTVETEAMRVRVLGTAFNVNTYGDDGKVYAALERGKVEVCGVAGGEALTLEAGEVAELEVAKAGEGVRLSAMTLQEQTDWQKGMFCFRRVPLPEILKQVARYYNVRFVGGEHAQEVFTGDISRNVTLRELLDAIAAQTTEVAFEIADNTVYVIKKRD